MPANIDTKHIRISFQSKESGSKADSSYRPVSSVADLASIYHSERPKS